MFKHVSKEIIKSVEASMKKQPDFHITGEFSTFPGKVSGYFFWCDNNNLYITSALPKGKQSNEIFKSLSTLPPTRLESAFIKMKNPKMLARATRQVWETRNKDIFSEFMIQRRKEPAAVVVCDPDSFHIIYGLNFSYPVFEISKWLGNQNIDFFNMSNSEKAFFQMTFPLFKFT